jgi:hypothetical protein
MKTIELELDEQTFERAQQLAGARRDTLERLIAKIIEQLAILETRTDPLLGMFAQEPELIDQVIESVMTSREMDGLRPING